MNAVKINAFLVENVSHSEACAEKGSKTFVLKTKINVVRTVSLVRANNLEAKCQAPSLGTFQNKLFLKLFVTLSTFGDR